MKHDAVISAAEDARAVALAVAERLSDEERRGAAIASASRHCTDPALARWSPATIAQGDAGIALLYAHLDRCVSGEGWDRHAHIALRRALEAAERTPLAPGMWTGLAGLACVTWLLGRDGIRYRNALEALEIRLCAQTARLAAAVRSYPPGLADGAFDVISGLSGIVGYLLLRTSDDRCADAATNAVSTLVRLADEKTPPFRWHTPQALATSERWREQFPSGYLNTGMAHGAAGMLAALSLALRGGIAVPRLNDAVHTLARWLQDQRSDDAWGVNWPPAVPAEVEDGAPDLQPSRAAWCYGNPGIARALWLAGAATEQREYLALAEAAASSVYRRPAAARAIPSPTICHGAAGLLQVSMRFALDTGAVGYAEAVGCLLADVLDAYAPDSLVGYRALGRDGAEVDSAGVLDGAAGVALVLASVGWEADPIWERALLIA